MLILANILQPLIDIFKPVLVFFHDSIGFGWGFSIVALTITIRALLLPLTLKQVRSMQSLQKIAPLMKEVQAKYKDDKQRQNQEMMKLYQEHKVNPFASCLPLLAQLPVFISLFYMLRLDLRHDICPEINPTTENTKPCGSTEASEFLFIPDITDAATGGVLITLVVLYVVTQLASSLLMSVSADKNQRIIFLALPFVFVLFIFNFPAGLIMYWITTNVWTLGQQMYVIKRNPTPGSIAFQQRQEKLRAKGKIKEDPAEVEAKRAVEEARANRTQPKRQSKSQRTAGAGAQQTVKKTAGTPKAAGAQGGGQKSAAGGRGKPQQAHGKKKPQSAKSKK